MLHQSQTLSGQIISALCDQFKIDWQLIAKTGVTTKKVWRNLSEHPKQDYDIVIVSLGVNDVTTPLSSSEWMKQQKYLIDQLRNCEIINIEHQLAPEQMASDGFHPGPEIYQHWGNAVAQIIRTRWL